MIYIASPYTHPDLTIMQRRYEVARDYAFQQIREGRCVFSPIVHCHDMYLQHKEAEANFNYWREYNIAMLGRASLIYVLMMPGWRESSGVTFEIFAAGERSIPVVYINAKGPEVDG